MVKCDLSFTFQGTAEQLITKAQKSIEDEGGTFSGNEQSGDFSVPTPLGNIVAIYSIEAQLLRVQVQKKPALVSCNKIENFLREQLG